MIIPMFMDLQFIVEKKIYRQRSSGDDKRPFSHIFMSAMEIIDKVRAMEIIDKVL